MKSRRLHTLGYSVEGRPIELWSDPAGPNGTLIIGGVHGDEPGSIDLVREFAPPVGNPVALLPLANPDGFARASRYNARGVDIKYLHLGGIVNFTDVGYAVPYFGMTIGATQFSPDETGLDDETKLSFSAGGGVKVPITDHFGVRFDARAFVTLLDSDGSIFCASGEGGAGCAIKAKSDTFVQYTATLGFVASF